MIIDFRVRPPYKSLGEGALWDLPRRESFAARFGCGISASIRERSMDLFLAEMAAAGITQAVVQIRLSIGMQNADLAELLQQYPDKFIGMIGVDPWQREQAMTDIQRYVLEGPASGIIIEHGFCQPALGADCGINYPLYALCEEKQIPVTLSFGGFLGPTVEHNAPKLIDQVAADFPGLKLIIAHGGWPFVQEMAHIAFNRPNLYLSPDIYAVNVPGSSDYLAMMNYFVPEKMIFGSAYPVIAMGDMVRYYKDKLAPAVYEQIMYRNAARVLGL